MRTRAWQRALGWIVIVLVGERASATEVAWFQLTAGCPVLPGEVVAGEDEEPQIVLCGGAGSFVFGKRGLQYDGTCPLLGKGTESPATLPVEPAPRLPASFPCDLGSCFHRSPGHPWVAIVDWPTAHGWSVAATVLEASDGRVQAGLYDLTAAGELGQWVPPVSDLHVLVQLCAVAEAVQAGDRPLAVNLSFGRRTTETGGASSGLGNAIGQVLSHLATVEGILPVAAAGNHQEMLFPASSPGVVSAGALDLARLQSTQKPGPSTQTPPAAEALMPGYGLYLSTADGEGSTWPPPPGSSYAAALLTGWLGGTLAGGGSLPVPLADGARWTPLTTANGLALALDGVPLAGSELAGPRVLLERALAALPSSHQPEVGAIVHLTGPAPPLPEHSVLRADSGNGPQPGVDPCVPCRGGGQGGAPESLDSVLVDFSWSGGLPPQTVLVAVLLRVGKMVYAFDGSRDPALLVQIEAGVLEGLTLSGVEGVFQPGEQPSLVLVVNVGGLAYWHEVPLHLRP